jgi:phosphoglycolate phosphatase
MTTSSLRGVLFDKDGTLIDFDATWIPAYHEAARRLAELVGKPDLASVLMQEGGWDADRGRWKPGSLLTSASNAEIVDQWLLRTGSGNREPVEKLVLDTFHEYAIGSAACIAGIPGLIRELSSRGYVIGVATMDDERTARDTLAGLGIDHFMSFICGADSGFGVKPTAGMLHAFCRHTGLLPAEVVMIGDSPHDLNMGRAAGAGMVVGVLSGAHGAADLTPLADHVVTDATALLELLQVEISA